MSGTGRGRYWRLVLGDGRTMGPWEGLLADARQAALRAGGWKRLPPGSRLEDAYPRPRRWRSTRAAIASMAAPALTTNPSRPPRVCDQCGAFGALLGGRVGARHLEQLCASCDTPAKGAA